jgi:hypothetical protein
MAASRGRAITPMGRQNRARGHALRGPTGRRSRALGVQPPTPSIG